MERASQPTYVDPGGRTAPQPWLGGILVIDGGFAFDVGAEGETRCVFLSRR